MENTDTKQRSDFQVRHDIEVHLIQHMGGDEMIARAARVSTRGELSAAGTNYLGQPSTQDPKELRGLLRYLMAHRHGSPFEHGAMTFFVRAPIFVFREWHRHRVGWSYNEESARYKPLDPVFWIPPPARKLMPEPGSSSARPTFVEAPARVHNDICGALESSYAAAYRDYERQLQQGVAREVARAVLPVAIYSSMWATCNPRSLMHFLSLRVHSPVAKYVSYPQAEIQSAAEQMEQLASQHWPMTLELFNLLGRVAP